MMSKKNMVVLEGGLVRDAELAANDKAIKMSIGVDMAGSEKGVANASGYFDLIVWTTPSKWTPEATAEQASTLFKSGALVKGARVSVVGQLRHERWTNSDGTKAQRVSINVESIDCYNKAGTGSTGSGDQAASVSSSSSIDEF